MEMKKLDRETGVQNYIDSPLNKLYKKFTIVLVCFQEMDLAAAPLTRTALREQVVDFTYPFMTAKMTALFHKDIEAESLEDLVNNKGK